MQNAKRLGELCWIGTCTFPNQEPLWLRVNGPRQLYDLPAWEWFDRPCQPAPAGSPWQFVKLGTGILQPDETGLSGRITSPTGDRGELRLYSEQRVDPTLLQTIAGAYQYTDDQNLVVFGSCGPQAEDFDVYYRLGEQVVHLFWIGGQKFLSERAEYLEFTPSGLGLIAPTGELRRADRMSLYHKQELLVESPAGHTLVGDLLVPAGKSGPFAVVVLVHGAGPEVRQDHLNFASYFLQQGLAVFAYDKRGWGLSTGEELWSEVYELADDAALVVEVLQQHAKISRIGLCGFSNGGWVAPLVASRCPGVAFVIAISGSGVSPARQEQIRRVNVARQVLGADEPQLQQIHEIWEHTFPFLATGNWTRGFEKIYLTLENDPALRSLPRHAGMPDGLQPVPPRRTRAEWQALGGSSPDLIFDPAPVFAALECPLLCVWGQEDSLVPVAESRLALEQALIDHPDFNFLVVPAAGHQLFLLSPDDRRPGDEIQRLKKSVRYYAPGVWEKITGWAANRNQPASD